MECYVEIHKQDTQQLLLTMADTWSAGIHDSRSFRTWLEGIRLAYNMC